MSRTIEIAVLRSTPVERCATMDGIPIVGVRAVVEQTAHIRRSAVLSGDAERGTPVFQLLLPRRADVVGKSNPTVFGTLLGTLLGGIFSFATTCRPR